MVSLDDAIAIATSLPEVAEGTKWGNRTWSVDGNGFMWERPMSKADIKRHQPAPPPEGPIIAIATEDLHEREAILALGRPGFFTIPHFDGYPAYLIGLVAAEPGHISEAIIDAWLTAAPQVLTTVYLEQHPIE